jgi:hypothetical protein
LRKNKTDGNDPKANALKQKPNSSISIRVISACSAFPAFRYRLLPAAAGLFTFTSASTVPIRPVSASHSFGGNVYAAIL